MSYTPTVWSSGILISARNLRNAEDQYDEAMYYFNSHIHDDLYYTEAEADAKFFHLSGADTLPAGLDADTIDGQHASDLIGSALPTGAIMVWYNTDGDIPSGWTICNGGSGTPDLRDRFVVGAGNTYSVGNTGGSTSVTPGAGTVAVATHTLTIDEIPLHTHSYVDYYPASDQSVQQLYYYYDKCTSLTTTARSTDYVGWGQPHGHTGSTFTPSGALENRPPYYALYYIQKVS